MADVVLYNGTSIRPAPFVQLEQAHVKLSDGRVVGDTIAVTIRGTLTVDKTGDTLSIQPLNARLATVLQKQNALRALFSVPGQLLEIQPLDGSAPTKLNFNPTDILFDEGIWTDKCDYTITGTGTSIDGDVDTNNFIENSTETWDFQEADVPHTYHVTHTVSATGKTVYDSTGAIPKLAWEYAKDFVQNKVGLGWNNGNTFSPKSGKDLAGLSVEAIDVQTDTVYSHVITESVGELDGTYSVTETWLLSANPYTEVYTVAVRKVIDEPEITTVATIQGTIVGLYVNLHDYESKITNATTRWNAVKGLLQGRVSSYVDAGITINQHPSQASVDIDPINGSITYNYEFNDRVLSGDTFESYTVTRRFSSDNSYTDVSIDGTIIGQLYADEVNDLRYARALTKWGTVKTLLYARAKNDSGITALQAAPIQTNVVDNPWTGTVTYSYTFNDRPNANVIDEYSVTQRFSREDGVTVVTVDGTITGLRNAGDPFTQKFANAQAYWVSIKDQLFGRATTYSGALGTINSNPYTTSVGENPINGTITYSYEFNNVPLPIVEGSFSEVINVVDQAAVPVIAVFEIPGRTQGPIIQDINTVRAKQRTVTIEVVMGPAKDISTFVAGPTVDVGAYTPSGSTVRMTEDQSNWSPTSGRYTRTVSWIYT